MLARFTSQLHRHSGGARTRGTRCLCSTGPQRSASDPAPVLKLRSSPTPPRALGKYEQADWNHTLGGYLGQILNARVYDVAVETPLQHAPSLSDALGNKVLLKREDMQPVFSFKIRGAYNKIVNLPQAQLDRGVVACSAGNHAQGVAMSAARLGVNATIVMPLGTPAIKVDAVRSHGGASVKIVLHGNTYDECAAEAGRFVLEDGLTLIHPFNDPLVIAGQGTIGMEVLKQTTGAKLDAVFVCCGGGGMLAGIAAYVKQVRPGVRVIGVEAADAAGMTASIEAGRQVTLDSVGLFADGAAVKTVGDETFRLCHRLVDEMVTVSTDQICAAIKAGFNDTRCVLEPAGALAIAGVTKYCAENMLRGCTFVAITSGANMDFDRLRFVSERADSTETLIKAIIPEQPGSFRKLYSHIYPRNVTGFSYRYHQGRPASVLASFQAIKGADKGMDAAIVLDNLASGGFESADVTHDELARTHLQHLAGGRAQVEHERLFRFEFPETPGALHRFLEKLCEDTDGWNVSAFHYRNHGADFGRVLVGVQVPPTETSEFNEFLNSLGYKFHEETHNHVYEQFMTSTQAE